MEEYRVIPLADLKESPLNPRKSFDAGKLQELADSIRSKGIITPLIARPADGGYELAAGHRRRRASEMAGLSEVPVVVRSMSDEDFLEVLTIENLQREDVHPLEEADGYRVLIDTWRRNRAEGGGREASREDVERVAHRVGKSVSYVYQRLKLLSLTPKARAAFERQKLTAGHAILVARLSPRYQEKLMLEEFASDDRTYRISVRGLGELIRDRFYCNLSGAGWKLGDSTLLPGVGACKTCPKLAGNSPELYEGLPKTVCTDDECFAAKSAAFADREVARLVEKLGAEAVVRISRDYNTKRPGVLGEGKFRRVWEHSNPCPSAVTGVWVDGRESGKSIPVCVDSKCPEHGGGSSRGVSGSAEEAARRKKAKAEAAARRSIFKAVLLRINGDAPPREILNLIARSFWGHVYGEHQKLVCDLLLWEKSSTLSNVQGLGDGALWSLIISLAVAADLTVSPWEKGGRPESLRTLADAYGVDVAAIDRTLAAKKSEAKKKKVQTSAPKKPRRA